MTGSLRAVGVLVVLRLQDERASRRSGAFVVGGFPMALVGQGPVMDLWLSLTPFSSETSMWVGKVYLTLFVIRDSVNLIFVKPCCFKLPSFSGLFSFLMRLLLKAAAPFRASCTRVTQGRPAGISSGRRINSCRVRLLSFAVGPESQDIVVDVSPSVLPKSLRSGGVGGAGASIKVPSFGY